MTITQSAGEILRGIISEVRRFLFTHSIHTGTCVLSQGENGNGPRSERVRMCCRTLNFVFDRTQRPNCCTTQSRPTRKTTDVDQKPSSSWLASGINRYKGSQKWYTHIFRVMLCKLSVLRSAKNSTTLSFCFASIFFLRVFPSVM